MKLGKTMKSEKKISKNLTNEILKSMSEADNKSIYQNPYSDFKYDVNENMRSTEIVLNVSNDHSNGEIPMFKVGSESIYETPYTYHRYDDYGTTRHTEKVTFPDSQRELGYEDPYSSNVYNVYELKKPRNGSLYAILKHKAKKKWWILYLVALLIIGVLIVGLSIYFRKIRENLVWSSTSAPTTSLTTAAITPTSLKSTAPISLTSTAPASFKSTTIETTESPTKEAVLVLSTYSQNNVPLVVGLNGEAILQFVT